MKPFFSIIIPYHNSVETIGPLLDSIYHSTGAPAIEIIIVDDASEKQYRIETIPYKTIKKIPIRIITFKKNKGPAIARNRGADGATGEYIVFLDGDVRLFPDAIHNLWKIYTDDPDIHAVTGVWSKEQKSQNFFPHFKALRDWSYWINERESGHYYYLFSTRIASIRREIFIRLGGFDQSYAGPLIEDIAFTYKIATRYAVIFAPNVRVYHEFEDFWPIARKYFLRAYYWALLFSERKKFDPVATTWKEAVTSITGAGIVGVFCCFIISLLLSISLLRAVLGGLLLFFLLLHVYLVRKFLSFVYREKGMEFVIKSFFMGLLLYCFITAGGVWSRINPPKK
jgi:glycosyltransferase involved in cell wall biosynthesis